MSLRVVKYVAAGICCLNSAVACVGTGYVGGRSLYHLYQRYVQRNDATRVQQLNERLSEDWTSLKTALLALPPLLGIFLASKWGNLGLSIGTSAADSTRFGSIQEFVDQTVNEAFFPLQTDPAPDGVRAQEHRDQFIKGVGGEAIELDAGREHPLPAVFIPKNNHPESVESQDLCVIMAHGNGMQLEEMEEFAVAIRRMNPARNSVLLYTLDGYGPHRQNGVKTCEESAKFDALAAAHFALQKGYKPEQIVFFGYSIGNVGATAAAHLAKTHCIFYKGFTKGAVVAANVCSNAARMIPSEIHERWFGRLIPWAQEQAGDFSKTVLNAKPNTYAAKTFSLQGQSLQVPLNGMDNQWHLQQMDKARSLLCIGGDGDHLMGSIWDVANRCYVRNFSLMIYENVEIPGKKYVGKDEGHVGGQIDDNSCGIKQFLESIRARNQID